MVDQVYNVVVVADWVRKFHQVLKDHLVVVCHHQHLVVVVAAWVHVHNDRDPCWDHHDDNVRILDDVHQVVVARDHPLHPAVDHIHLCQDHSYVRHQDPVVEEAHQVACAVAADALEVADDVDGNVTCWDHVLAFHMEVVDDVVARLPLLHHHYWVAVVVHLEHLVVSVHHHQQVLMHQHRLAVLLVVHHLHCRYLEAVEHHFRRHHYHHFVVILFFHSSLKSTHTIRESVLFLFTWCVARV